MAIEGREKALAAEVAAHQTMAAFWIVAAMMFVTSLGVIALALVYG